MKRISLSILITLLSLIACKQANQPNSSRNEISKVTVALSGIGCDAPCPFFAFSVDKNLTATFYGDWFADRQGYFKGAVSAITWYCIQTSFNKFILEGITIGNGKTDCPEIEFVINDDSRHCTTRFKEDTGSMTAKDLAILHWFTEIASRINLERTDSLAFETTIQYDRIPYRKHK